MQMSSFSCKLLLPSFSNGWHRALFIHWVFSLWLRQGKVKNPHVQKHVTLGPTVMHNVSCISTTTMQMIFLFRMIENESTKRKKSTHSKYFVMRMISLRALLSRLYFISFTLALFLRTFRPERDIATQML